MQRWIGIWLPFLDAAEAGLWVFWVLEHEIVAIERPAMQIADNRLHCETGPAVAWPNGSRYYFVRGVQVPEFVVMRPEEISVRSIDSERNVEVRRIMLDRYGAARFLRNAHASLIHNDVYGKLWRRNMKDDEPIVFVEVMNGSPEPIDYRPAPDEHGIWRAKRWFKYYLLRVPPTIKSAHEAVAWTYGRTVETYAPQVRT